MVGVLGDIDAVNRSGDSLTLSGPSTELRFALVPPVPTADIVDTDWALESLLDGETASSTVGETATLRLDSDGTFAASTGCRDVTGRYVEDDGQIRLSEYAAEDHCTDKDLRAQDEHVDTVIGGGFQATVEGDVLTMTTRGGELGLVYRSR
ncbi:META domain-containing protein [Phytoactinopolyspora alkaliphila]|uniref:META domain-containing protein n=1 Tax=Phytoactinopolyspora alkaliphila TaxID=1783498 RepID=A0A6N9YU68_9ACTN|nr:META domain-containing protein [Phytoactinopolyspora alkaliphila]NED98514.1 META domain-containing protein [Phytoactinopolyspora alkaliphila]